MLKMGFDYHRYVFHSPNFHAIVAEASAFLANTPPLPLPPPQAFLGVGVYLLYYVGHYVPYAKLAAQNREDLARPIYVGKAVPKGWRTARATRSDTPSLSGRLREHSLSIEQASNLRVADFLCRFMILNETESNLITVVEAELIRQYKPLWNGGIDGFGNHDPGRGRYNQAPSEWDVLHAGRRWASRLTGKGPSPRQVLTKVSRFLEKSALP